MTKDAINSNFCEGYPIKFCYILVVLILCKITLWWLGIVIRPRYHCYSLKCLFIIYVNWDINYEKVFELVVTGDDTKNTKIAVIQKKYKKHSIFLKKHWCQQKLRGLFALLLDFLKLHKVLSICAKFQVFGILQYEVKTWKH